ncbi:tripartite motif-containing protein 14-like [Hyperolius riggenbachi]|uniref:tripartite motif-containing protein 14-like n=1 Tax=Hyperolius riggenbachi TaxID=752182 RepID=UPI0035A2A166
MTSFENRKCSIHKRILEYYCTEDNACICVSCSLVGEHHGHKSETLEKASTEKKNTLKHLLQVMTSTQRETENRLHSLEKRKRKVQEKAAGLTDNVHVMVRDLKKQLDELEEQARSEVSTQEEQIILAISDMSQQLEKQRDELSEKKKHTEKLCNMNDPLTILQDKESRISDDNPYDYYEKLIQIGGVDLARIMQTLDTGLSDILSATEKNQLYIQEASDLLIDAHSAAKDVDVSTDLKTASWSVLQSQYPENKQRFEYNQVLCTGTFSSGKHLWKVETSNEGEWKLGICYATMDRRGYQSVIGNNDKSWCLHRYNAQYSVIHDSTTVRLPHQPSCSKLRIVLDYEAGQLSFSELCEPVRHLHTFTATFTEPLYPVFYLWINAWVKILD